MPANEYRTPGFQPVLPEQDALRKDVCLIVSDGQLIAPTTGDETIFWSPAQSQSLTADTAALHFVGYHKDYICWARELKQGSWPLRQCDKLSLRSLLGDDSSLFELASRAVQLVAWHRDHQFCSRCGRATESLGAEPVRHCKHCELSFYPRLSPCAIALVTRGEQCLLARHARHQSLFTCLAGYVEPGETVEQTVRREAVEEVGVTVGQMRYFGSQPWPFPGQLMLGFHAEYQDGQIEPDGVEIIEAGWFDYRDLPDIPGPYTLSGQLINDFIRRCRAG